MSRVSFWRDSYVDEVKIGLFMGGKRLTETSLLDKYVVFRNHYRDALLFGEPFCFIRWYRRRTRMERGKEENMRGVA